jgi:hypothetical protein
MRAAIGWLARLGASGAEENARRAVEAIARADVVVADLDERARLNGWAQHMHFGTAFDADGHDAFFDEPTEDSVSRSA